MLTQKVDKKKNQIMIFIIIVIVLIVAVILLKNYAFKGGASIGENSGSIINLNSGALKEAPRTFDAEILKNKAYQELIDNNIKIKKIEELQVGNNKPFLVEEVKK